jgi:hypothetical protein
MIILHNSYDKDSRDFVAAHGEGNIVIDWYAANGREEFMRIAKHANVSAFPSVIIHMPPYKILDEPKPGQHIIKAKVKDMDDVMAEISRINKFINQWALEKRDEEGFLPDLTEAELHRSDGYWKNQLTA